MVQELRSGFGQVGAGLYENGVFRERCRSQVSTTPAGFADFSWLMRVQEDELVASSGMFGVVSVPFRFSGQENSAVNGW